MWKPSDRFPLAIDPSSHAVYLANREVDPNGYIPFLWPDLDSTVQSRNKAHALTMQLTPLYPVYYAS